MSRWIEARGPKQAFPILALFVFTFFPAVSFAATGGISGRVTNSVGTGIANIDVAIYDLNQRYVGGEYTDASGNYSVEGLEPGSYILYFSASQAANYVPEYYNNKPDFVTADPVTVEDGQTTSGIDAVLIQAGWINGRVVSSTGAPLDSSWVIVIIYGLNNVTVRSVWPDADGYYSAPGIPPGNYRVLFDTWPGDYYYIEQWYNQKGSAATADTVAVTANQTTPNINARLYIGGIITGKVTDWTGAPVPLTNIQIYPLSDPTTPVRSVWTDAAGDYRAQGLWTGGTKVYFLPSAAVNLVPEWYNDKGTFATADMVAVVQEQTTPNINAQLDLGGTVSGRVTGPGGAGLPNVNVRVYDLAQNELRSKLTDANGNYSVFGLRTGSYRIYFDTLPAGNFISEWYNDKTTQGTADPVAVTAGTETPDINAQLAVGGIITGRVTDPASAGIAGINVQVFDLAETLVRSETTDSSGDYSVQGLSTGAYKVYFATSSAGNFFPEWYDDKGTFAAADSVAVTAGATTPDIDAELARGGTITGRVTDATGEAIAKIWVRVRDLSDNPVISVQTNTAGQYFAVGLATGSYKVLFEPSALDNFFPQYWNNKATFGAADIVPVTIGQTTSGIDATLVGGGVLSGRITNESAQPIPSVKVMLRDLADAPVAETLSDSNGDYSLQKLATGTYKLYFDASSAGNYYSEYYDDKATFETAAAIPLTAGETTSGVDAVLASRPVVVLGTMTLEHLPASATSGAFVTAAPGITGANGLIGTIGFDFVYDTAMFAYKSSARGTLTTDWTTFSATEVSAGRVRVTAASGGGTVVPAGATGSLALIKLQVKCVSFGDGTTAQSSVEAYASDLVNFTPVPKAATFTYNACPVLGDVNGDSRKTPGDAQRAFDIYLKLTTPTACQAAAADANCDGAVTPADAQAIFDDFIGLSILPKCCAESPVPSPAAANTGAAVSAKTKDAPSRERTLPGLTDRKTIK